MATNQPLINPTTWGRTPSPDRRLLGCSPTRHTMPSDEGDGGGDSGEKRQSSLDTFLSQVRDQTVAKTSEPVATELDPAEPPPEDPEPSLIRATKSSSPSAGPTKGDGDSPIRTFEMPSSTPAAHRPPPTDVMYHDLGSLYPDAPVPDRGGGMVLHRSVLHDMTGIAKLLDWVADGDPVIVELARIMSREVEFRASLSRLSAFIEDDLGGQIIQLTDSRLLLLPPGCRGVKGVEMEAFVDDV